MTFIVNQDGVLYEKDLGKKTENVAEATVSSSRMKPGKRCSDRYLEIAKVNISPIVSI
jgi:hypothetical protein